MSRNITIIAQYLNNKHVCSGVHNPHNMEWESSVISMLDIEDMVNRFNEYVGNKRIKNITVSHYLSGKDRGVKELKHNVSRQDQLTTYAYSLFYDNKDLFQAYIE